MDSESADSSTLPPPKASDRQPPAAIQTPAAADSGLDNSPRDAPSRLSPSGISSWAKSLKIPQPLVATQDESPTGNAGKSTFARFTSGLALRLSPKAPLSDDSSDGTSTAQPGFIGTITKGLVDSSRNAVKAVQVKARHVVSQNKRRYQEGGFDLDMTYITENIIAMGFPAGDLSSGFFGYVEGLYRNHMEEVIKFFETHHKGKYKVYNLCSERLYDASLFEGKVACFPFDDHNCPPIQLIISFCQSAYSWLKEDIENVVVVHCKAGMARTGLMISSLLLFLKFFPTAEESIDYYNQKRCFDGKGLVLPSQIRYVKYFERVLTYFNGECPPGRRCMLRGFRIHRCPYWIRPSITVSDHNGVLFSTKKHPRTKDLSPEDFWFSAPKKGVMVFALPGEPGLSELGDEASLSPETYNIALKALEEALRKCECVNNSIQSVIEPSSPSIRGPQGVEEVNQTSSSSKTNKKNSASKKRQVHSEPEVVSIGTHDNWQPVGHTNLRAHVLDMSYESQESMQDMEQLNSRAAFDGYFGTQQIVQGMGQLNSIVPSRDEYYSNQHNMQGLGQLNSIAPIHDGHYLTQQRLHGMGQLHFRPQTTETCFDVQDSLQDMDQSHMGPSQLHGMASKHIHAKRLSR